VSRSRAKEPRCLRSGQQLGRRGVTSQAVAVDPFSDWPSKVLDRPPGQKRTGRACAGRGPPAPTPIAEAGGSGAPGLPPRFPAARGRGRRGRRSPDARRARRSSRRRGIDDERIVVQRDERGREHRPDGLPDSAAKRGASPPIARCGACAPSVCAAGVTRTMGLAVGDQLAASLDVRAHRAQDPARGECAERAERESR